MISLSGMISSATGMIVNVYQLNQNVGANKSIARADVYGNLIGTSSRWTSSTTMSVTVDGQTKSMTVPPWNKQGAGSWYIGSIDFDVYHNPDGSKSAWVSFSWSHPWGTASSGGTLWFDTIPRASTPTTDKNEYDFGDVITIYTNRASGNFTHEVFFDFAVGNYGNPVLGGVTDLATFTIPLDWMTRIPNDATGQGRMLLRTWNGGTHIGDKEIWLRFNVPSTVIPTIKNITHSEAEADVKEKIGKYVQLKSRLNLAITGASGKYGSTIKSYYLEVAGQSLDKQSGITQPINANGSVKIIARVTDSRGRVGSKQITVNILPYQNPKIESLKGQRCNANGELNDYGTYIKVSGIVTVSSLKVGTTEKNNLKYNIQSRQRPNGSYTTKITQNKTVLTFNFQHILATYSVDYAYDFMVQALDIFDVASVSLGVIGVGKVTMQWGIDWVAIGRLGTQEEINNGYKLMVGGKAKFDDDIVDKNGKEVISYEIVKEWNE